MIHTTMIAKMLFRQDIHFEIAHNTVKFSTTTGTADGVNVISSVWMLVRAVYCYCKECAYNLGYYIMNTYNAAILLGPDSCVMLGFCTSLQAFNYLS
jgi:hypothetical protein